MRHGAHPGGGGAARLRGGLARLRRAEHGRRVHRRQDPLRRLRHHLDERRREHRLLRRALVPDARAGLLLDEPRAERRRDSGDLVLVRLSRLRRVDVPGQLVRRRRLGRREVRRGEPCAHRLRLLWVRVGCHARHERRVRLLGEIRADRRDLRQDEGGRRQGIRRVRGILRQDRRRLSDARELQLVHGRSQGRQNGLRGGRRAPGRRLARRRELLRRERDRPLRAGRRQVLRRRRGLRHDQDRARGRVARRRDRRRHPPRGQLPHRRVRRARGLRRQRRPRRVHREGRRGARPHGRPRDRRGLPRRRAGDQVRQGAAGVRGARGQRPQGGAWRAPRPRRDRVHRHEPLGAQGPR